LADFVEIQIEAGSTFVTQVDVSDASGMPKNLNGYNVRSQLRKSYYSTNAVEFIITMLDAPNGSIELKLEADTTSNIRAGRYVYDVEIEEISTGTVTRIFEGIATLLPNVTR
jgi:hypothetical protein